MPAVSLRGNIIDLWGGVAGRHRGRCGVPGPGSAEGVWSHGSCGCYPLEVGRGGVSVVVSGFPNLVSGTVEALRRSGLFGVGAPWPVVCKYVGQVFL